MYTYMHIYIKMWKSYFYSMTIFKYQFIDNINCFVYILFHLTIFILFFSFLLISFLYCSVHLAGFVLSMKSRLVSN